MTEEWDWRGEKLKERQRKECEIMKWSGRAWLFRICDLAYHSTDGVCVCVCARLRKLTLAAPSHISFQSNLQLCECAYQFSHETQT